VSPLWRRILVAVGFGIGIAVVALLAIIAYALLSDEGGGPPPQVAQPTETATPRPSPTATPRASPTAALPTVTPEATQQATPQATEEPPPAPVIQEQPSPTQEEPAPPTEEPPVPTQEPLPATAGPAPVPSIEEMTSIPSPIPTPEPSGPVAGATYSGSISQGNLRVGGLTFSIASDGTSLASGSRLWFDQTVECTTGPIEPPAAGSVSIDVSLPEAIAIVSGAFSSESTEATVKANAGSNWRTSVGANMVVGGPGLTLTGTTTSFSGEFGSQGTASGGFRLTSLMACDTGDLSWTASGQ
jgi:hypothetical protein